MVLPLARLWWPRARFVYDVHEDFAELMMIRDWLPDRLKPVARTLTDRSEKLLSRLAHGIVAVTPPLATPFPHVRKVSAMNFPTADFFEGAAAASRRGGARRFDIVHLGTLNRRRAAFLSEVLTRMRQALPEMRSLVRRSIPGDTGISRRPCPGRVRAPRDGRPRRSPTALGGFQDRDRCSSVGGATSRAGIGRQGVRVHGGGMRCRGISDAGLRGRAVALSRAPGRNRDRAREAPRNSPKPRCDSWARSTPAGVRGRSIRRFALAHMNWDPEAMNIVALYLALLRGDSCVT